MVLILDYVGPAIATFMTLRHREASRRGPARAALSLTGHGSGWVSRNTLCNIFHDGFLEDLPPALRIIDQQQRGMLAAMAVSDAPVHVIHALAGCGKPTVLQCLVALYAARHARMLDSEAGSRVLVVVLRARTLRHEFLQALLQSQVLQPGQVIFGGAPP